MIKITSIKAQLRTAFLATTCAASLSLGGCAKDINARGNLPPEQALSQLQPGQQTRQDIQLILGTPSTVSTLGDETWYYVSAITTQYAFYSSEELKREVYALSFDERGILQEVKNLGLEDGEDLQIVERETPTMGREFSLIEQLIGNLGRFDRGQPEAGP
ncbi:MAG: outer membrane protein assembly factor BamE [Rhodospirillaceae bacterium]|nr:outer membrane protein assembly factor BamE [Rhodospirillaceae bacterium]